MKLRYIAINDDLFACLPPVSSLLTRQPRISSGQAGAAILPLVRRSSMGAGVGQKPSRRASRWCGRDDALLNYAVVPGMPREKRIRPMRRLEGIREIGWTGRMPAGHPLVPSPLPELEPD